MQNRHERRSARKRQSKQQDAPSLVAQIVFDGVDCFFVIDGQRMAKRENRHWIPLVPDFSMHDNFYGGSLDALDEIKDNHHAH